MPSCNETKDGNLQVMSPMDLAAPSFDQTAPPSPEISKEEVATPPPQNDMVSLHQHLETVIVFDWDDTLLASTFLSSKGYRLDCNMVRCPDVEAQLRELERSVCHLLSVALQYGPVHIITNAETGWVQMSAQKFMPAVLPLLDSVSVISARSTYEAQFPDAPLKWKTTAFQEVITKSLTSMDLTKNVISFGDSHVEREAVRAVTRGWEFTRTKSVKFHERPSTEQLRRQLDLVRNCFQYIYAHEADLDLMLTITVPPSP